MEPSRFHLLLTISLAGIVGFGAAHMLSASDAVAYPSGAVVSYGSNPVFSFGGSTAINGSSGATQTVSIPTTFSRTGYDFVITDIILTTTMSASCYSSIALELQDSSDTLGVFGMMSSDPHQQHSIPLVIPMGSGVRVADGESLTWDISTQYGYGCSTYLYYTFSGYYAEP